MHETFFFFSLNLKMSTPQLEIDGHGLHWPDSDDEDLSSNLRRRRRQSDQGRIRVGTPSKRRRLSRDGKGKTDHDLV